MARDRRLENPLALGVEHRVNAGDRSGRQVRESSFSDTSHQGITQLALDALPGGSADDELAGLMPTIFERVDALGIYTFDADPRRTAPAATRRVSFR